MTKKQIIGQALARVVERARSGFERTVVGLMTTGSELGREELLQGALQAQAEDPRLSVLAIGPPVSGYEKLEWLPCGEGEAEVATAMEQALTDGLISGAVALHYPFPLGVTTIGRVVTPAKGRSLLLAATTGTSAAQPSQALVYNAIYGLAVAKSLGLAQPSLGLLNLAGAGSALRVLQALQTGGYQVNFGLSQRADGGAILRGNDILNPTVDICLCDSLTGNVLMKMFSAWNTGGAYEALGWGYGPSTGRGWRSVVSIISRASGAPVVAGALKFTAAVLRGGLPDQVATELAAAEKAGLNSLLESLTPLANVAEDVKAPPSRPTGAEIAGVDVLEMEAAVKSLWKEGLYAESAMGCTGPVIKVPQELMEKAREVLKHNNFI